jgi:hypothetical protein
VGKSQVGENAGRGVFTTVDIPARSYIGVDSSSHFLHFPWTTNKVVDQLFEEWEDSSIYQQSDAQILYLYSESYGFSGEPFVSAADCCSVY